MKKVLRYVAVLSLLVLTFSSNAMATDFGLFLEGASGTGEGQWDSSTTKWDLEEKRTSIGFVLDTATTNESGFNYRLNVGLSSLELEDDFGAKIDATGIYAENIFGFALIKKETFRWWLGPLVRVGAYTGDDQYNDYTAVEFGVGIVSGMNFKPNNSIIFAPSIGLRVNGYAAVGESKTSFYEEDLELNSTVGFINMALLF